MSAVDKQLKAGANRERSPADVAEGMFRESPYLALRSLKCRYDDGVLTIAGRVPSFYLKQLAQTAVQDVSRVQQVENRVEVGD